MDRWWEDDQALAYAIVEQGRQTCERLGRGAPEGDDLRRLRTAHRTFGIAGYAVSDHLLRGVRPALYVAIQEAGPVRLPGPPGAPQALLFAVHASAAVERCLETPHLLGQMQVAHRAVRQAHTAITAVLGVTTAAQLTVDATRAGHLERTWQQLKLRPPSLGQTLRSRVVAAAA